MAALAFVACDLQRMSEIDRRLAEPPADRYHLVVETGLELLEVVDARLARPQWAATSFEPPSRPHGAFEEKARLRQQRHD
jgi:hypothetical protein